MSVKASGVITLIRVDDGANGTNGIILSATAPSSPVVGQLWQNTSTGIIRKYNGNTWDIWFMEATNLSVENLSAISANLGTVNAGVVQSNNYTPNNTGMKLDLNNGLWDSKNFRISEEGVVYISQLIAEIGFQIEQYLINGQHTIFQVEGGAADQHSTGFASLSTTLGYFLMRNPVTFLHGLSVIGDVEINNKSLLDRTYPVGAVYMSGVSTSPATLFGGTWASISSRFLYTSTAAGALGGASSISHQHIAPSVTNASGTENGIAVINGFGNSGTGTVHSMELNTTDRIITAGTYGDTWLANTSATSVSTMPPYYTVYCWRRTA